MLKVRLNHNAIELAMVRRNMSQNMLATRIGISSGYISQLMCGNRNASPRVRQKILDALVPLIFDDVFIIEEDRHGEPTSR